MKFSFASNLQIHCKLSPAQKTSILSTAIYYKKASVQTAVIRIYRSVLGQGADKSDQYSLVRKILADREGFWLQFCVPQSRQTSDEGHFHT